MDYDAFLALPPYIWPQSYKEQRYLPYMKALTAHHQAHCHSYGQALARFGCKPSELTSLTDIPFVPITLFKQHQLQSITPDKVVKVMVSSGTSGQAVSRICLDAANARHQQLALLQIVTSFLPNARLPMLIIDSPATLRPADDFTARSAAILGFSIFARHRCYALDNAMQLDKAAIRTFAEKNEGKPVIIFGFTFMIWKYLCQAAQAAHLSCDLSHAVVLHGGGWKKMQDAAVSATTFKEQLAASFGITHVHNYYGMAEQTGCIYMECEYGHLHASIFSDIIIRQPADFSVCPPGIPGIIQVLSPLATAYPGHSLLTEDLGMLLGTDDCPCGRKGRYFTVLGRIPAAEIRGCSDTYGQ